MKRSISSLIWVLIFAAILTSAFKIQHVKAWTGTVYIRANGSIEPSGAPISTSDNVTYTLTGNITSEADGIVVERSDIIIDGRGFMVVGTEESSNGISLAFCNNVTVTNVTITKFAYGINVFYSNNNNITKNMITNNILGINLHSSNTSIYGNNITNKRYGITVILGWNNNISENEITRNEFGIILMDNASNNKIFGNNLIENEVGIMLSGHVVLLEINGTMREIRSLPSNNYILRNNFTKNQKIYFYQSDCNIISENNIEGGSVQLYYSPNTIISRNNINMSYFVFQGSNGTKLYHNNFINAEFYVDLSEVFWDDGYPSGGNYWSDYNGTDIYCGSSQNETGSDGIGDAPYVYTSPRIVPKVMVDRYPLMSPVSIFDVNAFSGTVYNIEVVSNSTISGLYFNPEGGAFLGFNVIGENGTAGFCRVAIPESLLWTDDEWSIYVNGEQATDYKIIPDENIIYLYFTYNHTTITLMVKGTHAIPVPSTITLLPIMLTTLVPLLRKNLIKVRKVG